MQPPKPYRDSTFSRALALHVADQGLISAWSLKPTGCNSEPEVSPRYC